MHTQCAPSTYFVPGCVPELTWVYNSSTADQEAIKLVVVGSNLRFKVQERKEKPEQDSLEQPS